MSTNVEMTKVPTQKYDSHSQIAMPTKDGIVNDGYSQENGEIVEKKMPVPDPATDHDSDDDSSEDESELTSAYARQVHRVRSSIVQTCVRYKKVMQTMVAIAIAVVYFVYFGYAIHRSFDPEDEPIMRLIIVTGVVVVGVFINELIGCWRRRRSPSTDETMGTESPGRKRLFRVFFWVATLGTVVFVIAFVVVDVVMSGRSENLISGLGMIVFVLLLYIFSKHPARVNWRAVFWGLALQFYLALFILRTDIGYQAFKWLGDRATEFLMHTDAGSKFVFGDDYIRHFFAFKVLTVIVFFSSIVSVLYYLGAMQFVIRYLARFLAFSLGTSPTESLNAAGNIFLGQTEAPLMIRPFIQDMTRSEIHAVCTGGFATIAGSVMAAYILMDVPANHLLSASVMSAPAALAMSKLFYPETKKTKARAEDVYNMEAGKETNIVEAASNGAAISIKLVANIAANLIAFIAILEFINMTLTWFGHRIQWKEPEHEELTFYMICSYLFYPVAWLLGTSNTYCDIRKVARLIGLKTFLNEFVAYAELGNLIANTNAYVDFQSNPNTTLYHNDTRITCDAVILGNGTVLEKGILTDRSIVLATYALCGFSNIGSMGIILGALSAMAPNRKRDVTKVVVRALISGTVACFMTACISGMYERTVLLLGRQLFTILLRWHVPFLCFDQYHKDNTVLLSDR